MALTGDERRLLATANLHLPGRQVDAAQVTRDLWRLSRWEQARMRDVASTLASLRRPAGPDPAHQRLRVGVSGCGYVRLTATNLD